MLTVTDAAGRTVTVTRAVVVSPAEDDLGTLLAVDCFRRTADVLRVRVSTLGVPGGLERFNVKASDGDGPGGLVLSRPGGADASAEDPLAARLAWATGSGVSEAAAQLDEWRRWVAAWAEEPSKPICAQVQQDLLAALADDLDTRTAVDVLRGSLDLGLPGGCLFETWAWADRLLAVDLAAAVGRLD
jgi:hypothetical protein